MDHNWLRGNLLVPLKLCGYVNDYHNTVVNPRALNLATLFSELYNLYWENLIRFRIFYGSCSGLGLVYQFYTKETIGNLIWYSRCLIIHIRQPHNIYLYCISKVDKFLFSYFLHDDIRPYRPGKQFPKLTSAFVVKHREGPCCCTCIFFQRDSSVSEHTL